MLSTFSLPTLPELIDLAFPLLLFAIPVCLGLLMAVTHRIFIKVRVKLARRFVGQAIARGEVRRA